jgi:hypothetical protein
VLLLGEEFQNGLRRPSIEIHGLLPESQMAQDALDDLRLIDEGDDAHGLMTGRAVERIGLPDFLDEVSPFAGWAAARNESGNIDHLRGAESQSLDDQESDLNAGWSVDC